MSDQVGRCWVPFVFVAFFFFFLGGARSGYSQVSSSRLAIEATPETLDYMGFHGGPAAGRWDKKNFHAFVVSASDEISPRYASFDLYSNPVPSEIHRYLSSKTPPDVFGAWVGGALRDYVERGQIAEISDLWARIEGDWIYPESLKRLATYRGKPYFLPQAVQWNPIWFRKEIFAKLELTPPKTWKDLLALCDRMHEAGVTPFACSVTGWSAPVLRWLTSLSLRLNGPSFHEQLSRGRIAFTDPRVRKIFEHWAELFTHHAFGPASHDYGAAVRDFVSGKAAMYNLGEWLFEAIPRKMTDEYDFFSFPEINPEVEKAEIVWVYGAFMTTEARPKKDAIALLEFLGGKESQTSMARRLTRVSGNLDVDSALYSELYQRGLKFVEDAGTIVQLFEFNTDPRFVAEVYPILVKFWGDQEVDDALSALESARKRVFTGSSEGSPR